MIDLHCHLLPGIDDGPSTAQEAVAVAERLAGDGVRVVAATPHLREDHPGVRLEELADRTKRIEAEVNEAGLNLDVVPAAEVDLLLAGELSADGLRLASYGQRGTDVLVESPYGPLISSFEQMLFDRFTARGLRVLLAHPERNPTFRDEPKRLVELVRRGVLTQVTAGALTIRTGRSRTRRMAEAMVREGVAHVIASDSHGADITRAPLSAGVTAAEAIDRGRARWMVTDAPAAILAGEPLPPPPTVTRPKRRWILGRRSTEA